MQKDFDQWNQQKKHIDAGAETRLYHQREAWWCSLGVNVGSEQDGAGLEYQRPVLIVKGLSANTCLILPLTTSPSQHTMRAPVGIVDSKQASAILSQIRIIDTKRLVEKIGFIEKETFEKIRKAVKDML